MNETESDHDSLAIEKQRDGRYRLTARQRLP